MHTRYSSPAAFVLGELIVVLIASSVVIATLLAGLIALVRGLQPPVVRLAGETLPIAPTFGAFPSAVRLNEVFSARAAEARAIYVFGGTHLSIPPTAAPALMRPLKLQRRPEITDFNAGLPMNAQSFYERYATLLGEEDSSAAADDFTVLIIGPSTTGLGVKTLAQVRRQALSVNDGGTATPFVVREVKLWDVDAGTLRYVHAEPPAVASRVFVGAVHTWMRYNANSAVAEEGPVCVVLPDPWVYGGARGRPDDIPPFSRFTYFLPVSP